jgi:cysteinyl-tRNA synthetase
MEIESLIKERKLARTAKNWQRADEIRQLLAGKKIILKDTPTRTTWRVE